MRTRRNKLRKNKTQKINRRKNKIIKNKRRFFTGLMDLFQLF